MRFLSFFSAFCVAAATRSVIIGDSLFRSGIEFLEGPASPLADWLTEWAGHDIENHALVGASVEGGWVESIRDQYRDLEKQPVITTLIMDGGGNDICSHRSDCEIMNDVCRSVIDHSVVMIQEIMEEAIRDGVRNILYLGPYYVPGLEAAADYACPRLMAACEATDSHFVNPLINATNDKPLHLLLGDDGLHPTTESYKILAQMIWTQKMRFNIPI